MLDSRELEPSSDFDNELDQVSIILDEPEKDGIDKRKKPYTPQLNEAGI